MKSKLAIILSAFALLTGLNAQAEGTPASKDVAIAINDVFVPGGFDSNTEAYVVVSGIFPNSCYTWKGITRRDAGKFEHEITPMAAVNQGMCMMVLVPFSRALRLGKLDQGKHTLRFLSNDGTFLEKTLVVE
jgi:hypothetical protein